MEEDVLRQIEMQEEEEGIQKKNSDVSKMKEVMIPTGKTNWPSVGNGAKLSLSPRQSSPWTCTNCSWVNRDSSNHCEICSFLRPPPVANRSDSSLKDFVSQPASRNRSSLFKYELSDRLEGEFTCSEFITKEWG